LQHGLTSFCTEDDLLGKGKYLKWEFFCLEKTVIEDPDEADLIRNRMMYTLTGEKEFLNKINSINGKRGGQAKKLTKKRKRSGFYKRPNRSANKKRKESHSVPAFTTSIFNEESAVGCKCMFNNFL
jgi:hypothetical protein